MFITKYAHRTNKQTYLSRFLEFYSAHDRVLLYDLTTCTADGMATRLVEVDVLRSAAALHDRHFTSPHFTSLHFTSRIYTAIAID